MSANYPPMRSVEVKRLIVSCTEFEFTGREQSYCAQ